jgi:hypothetical protein
MERDRGAQRGGEVGRVTPQVIVIALVLVMRGPPVLGAVFVVGQAVVVAVLAWVEWRLRGQGYGQVHSQ